MDEVNKTLYIPLYGKAQVSKKGIILHDPKAEEIWEKERFSLKGKAKSKWLTYYMSMRARVFDDWVRQMLAAHPKALVLHIGCGMDSRIHRVGAASRDWYDVDFPEVIEERKKYYQENKHYHMLGADASSPEWVARLPDCSQTVVILEGISMYLKNDEVAGLFSALQEKYEHIYVLMDVYTTFGARASKYKNPINNVGVTTVYGIDDPASVVKGSSIVVVREHSMTPEKLVNELRGFDKGFFTRVFAGNAARMIYRLFEYRTT